jgi:hypothetical protein
LQTVQAQHAGHRIAPQPFHQVLTADDDARLGSAQELVTAEGDEVGSLREQRADGNLVAYAKRCQVDEIAASPVDDEGNAALARQSGERSDRRLFREADDLEIARVDLEEYGRLRPRSRIRSPRSACRFVVPTSFILAPEQARISGHTKRATDLDELTARDHDLASPAKRPQREENCPGIVVDGESRVPGEQPQQQPVEMRHSVPARALREVVLEIQVPGGGFCDAARRRSRENRPAQIRVGNDARRIDDDARRR